MPTVCVLLVLVLPILRASMDTDTAMDTALAESFVYRFTLHSNVDPKAGVKLLWTCQTCGTPSQKVGDEGAIKQESQRFKLTSSRKTCEDFVQAAQAKLLVDHATCPGLPDADELLDGLRHA